MICFPVGIRSVSTGPVVSVDIVVVVVVGVGM